MQTAKPRGSKVTEELRELQSYHSQLKYQERLLAKTDIEVDNLIQLVGVIEQHGISKPVMLTADPNQNLVSLNVVSSYETLAVEAASIEDAQTVSVIEKIKNLISTIWKKLISFLKKIGSTLRWWIDKIFSVLITFEALTSRTLSKLVKAESKINTKKLQDTEATVVPRRAVFDSMDSVIKAKGLLFKSSLTKRVADFSKLRLLKSSDMDEVQVNNFGEIVSKVEEANNTVIESLNTIGASLDETKLVREEGTLGSLGWEYPHIVNILNTVTELTVEFRSYQSTVRRLVALNDNFVLSLTIAIKDLRGFRGHKEQLVLKNKLVQSTRKTFTKYRAIVDQLFRKLILFARHANQLGRLALSAT